MKNSLLLLLIAFTSLSMNAQDQSDLKRLLVLEDNTFTLISDPDSDMIAVQVNGLLKRKMLVTVYDANGKLIENKVIRKGSTICHINTLTYYNGTYRIKISNGTNSVSEHFIINKEF